MWDLEQLDGFFAVLEMGNTVLDYSAAAQSKVKFAKTHTGTARRSQKNCCDLLGALQLRKPWLSSCP